MKYLNADGMSDVDLVATILGKRKPDEACVAIAAAMSNVSWKQDRPLETICREQGSVGPRSIARLESALELGRRALAARAQREIVTITTPEDVADLIRPLVAGQEREHFYCLALDTKNHVKKVIHVSVGSLNASIVHPRELFREAVRLAAAAVVVCHNHPSSDVTPSGADIQLTRRLVRAGDVLGIDVLDHVIVGDSSHVSLREAGLM